MVFQKILVTLLKNFNRYLPLLLVLVILIILGKIVQVYLLSPLVENAFNGESFEYLNKLITHHHLKDPSARTLDFYRLEVPKYINRLLALVTFSLIFIWIIFRDNKHVFKQFFLAEESAFKLALLRIVVTGYLLYLNFPKLIEELVYLGSDATVPPLGWSEGLVHLLVNQDISYFLGIAFTLFCLGAFVGIYTRFMLLGAAFIGLFVLGIPQFYGKIDHYHNLWHLLLLLSFSPSGYSLSIDCWRKKIPQINLNKSIAFGLPIRISMIIIGLVYFFPGFWKFAFSGFDWAFSDNLAFKLHSKWLEFGGWLPSLRVDRYPFLYKTAALSTLIIELGFIFGIFFKKTRLIFVVAAFSFHLSVYYLMRISFLTLMIIYIVFIDWDRIALFFKVKADYLKEQKYQLSNKFLPNIKRVGILLVAGNIITGFLLINSWPFAVYPTFASIETGSVPSIIIQAKDIDDKIIYESIPLLDKDFISQFKYTGRLRGFLETILNKSEVDENQVNTLISISQKSNSMPKNAALIEVYEIRLDTNPDAISKVEKMGRFLFRREL